MSLTIGTGPGRWVFLPLFLGRKSYQADELKPATLRIERIE